MVAPPRSWRPNTLTLFVLAAALFRLALALRVTDFVLVDDAYIHLRYARNLVERGALVYNAGEAVFGVTSPSFVLLSALLYAVFGSATEVATVCLSIVLWSALTLLVARELRGPGLWPLVGCLSLLPVFVDNQLLGMESALFTLLLAGASFAALRGALQAAALWYGLALVTRPEAVLLAPWLLLAALRATRPGAATGPSALGTLRFWSAALGPGSAWCAAAWSHYGTVVPQSLLAKSGWNNAHYDALSTAAAALIALPRLTLMPFVDHLPVGGQWVSVAAVLAAIGVTIWVNIRRHERAARHWLWFYLTYIGFFLVGKGATEASWYAVPSSFALLLAARPLFEWLEARARQPRLALGALLVGAAAASAALAALRAPLLRSYWEGYGACAAALGSDPRVCAEGAPRVVIGEIGVFGYTWPGPVTDLGALVSPEVLPWKNAGASFVECVQRSGASAFVISERALTTNDYPSLRSTAKDEAEREWLARCELVAAARDKRAYFIPESLRPRP